MSLPKTGNLPMKNIDKIFTRLIIAFIPAFAGLGFAFLWKCVLKIQGFDTGAFLLSLAVSWLAVYVITSIRIDLLNELEQAISFEIKASVSEKPKG